MQSKISIVKLDTEISPNLLSKAYALNQLNVPEVGSLKDEQEFRALIDVAKINFFVYKDNDLIGFMVCMTEGAKYHSENYKFLSKKFNSFIYVDRIAIDKNSRRLGIGNSLYRMIAEDLSPRTVICCEVNTVPKNTVSLKFHDSLGFKACGSKDFADGHSVIYLYKDFSAK